MPLSGSLPKESTYKGPYPRPKDSIWYILRTILLFCWFIIGFYCGNAVWNFYYTDYSKPNQLSTFNDFLNALVVPAFMRDPNAPLGISVTFAIFFVCLLIGCMWATYDRKLEQKALQEREINEGVDKGFQTRGLDKQFAKPQGPPLDIDNPSHPNEFIGRTDELDWLLKRLRVGKKNRVTALWGRDGIGKTTLVVEVIRRLHAERRFKDGMAIIPCQGINSVEEVLKRIIIRFDPHGRPPDSSEPHELRKDIRRLLDKKNALIVLDSVERSLAIKEVIEFLFAAKDIAILLTARHMLSWEARRKLEPLSAIEALNLFAQSFEEAVNDPAHTGYNKAERIVKKLGYNPYAIRTVGGYAKSCGRDLGVLEQELNRNESLLRVLDVADDDKAVRLAFETSTKEQGALPAEARKLFLALIAFPDAEFSRAAVLILAKHLNAEKSMDMLLQSGLVDAYVNQSMPEQSHRERWQLQSLTRAFAEDRFRQLPETECRSIQRTIALYYADYSEEASEETLSYDEINIMGALDWACEQQENELVVRLCTGMQYFWVSQPKIENGLKYLQKGIKVAETIAKNTQKDDDRIRLATLQQTYGQLLQKDGQVQIARTNFDQALTFFQQVTDQQGKYETLASLGEIAQQQGKLKEAENYYRQSLTILRTLQEEQKRQDKQKESEAFTLYRQGEGEILTSLGELAQQRGRLREAERYYEKSLDILRETGSRESLVHDLIHLGEIAQYRNQKGEAEKRFGEALTITRQVYNRERECIVLVHMADLALSFNEIRGVHNLCQKALAIAHEEQYRHCECRVCSCMGRLMQIKGRLDEAEKYYKDALEIAREAQDKREESKINFYLGEIVQTKGHIGEAEKYYRAALAIADTFQDAIVYAEVALKLGALLIEHNIEAEDKPHEGCDRIREAVQFYASMKLRNETKAREISKRLGCGR